MNYKKKILKIILLLGSFLLANNEPALSINAIQNKEINLRFQFINNFEEGNHISKNEFGYPVFNYILNIPYDDVESLEFDLNSDNFLMPFNNQKNYFISGIKKNEQETLNEHHVYISKEIILNDKKNIVLTIDPIKLVNNQFRIYNDIEIKIKLSNNINELNILSPEQASSIITRESTNLDNPVLLIIAPDGDNIFNLMTPLINWKKLKGYTVLYHTLSETGITNIEIKNFIQNLYENGEYPPNYICLVGDADGQYSIPTFNENLSIYNGESDHPYTLLAGNDNISDVAIGRLSIQSLSDLATIINKIINYEQSPYISDNNWFQKALCVGDSAISGLSTIITNQLIAELMIQYGYNYIIEVYQYPFVSQIENSINSGVSFYNYRGFSGSSGWQKDGADNLNNGYMLPFASVITCDTGSFLQDEESISENFLRAGSISIPKGGIAAVGMSTQGTHTMFNNCLDYGLYHGIFVEKINTIGDAINYAKNNLLLNYPHNPNNYIEIFSHWINLMGDPTLNLWTSYPKELNIIFNEQIPFGQNQINITSYNLDGAIDNATITITDSEFNFIAQGITNDIGELVMNLDIEDLQIGTYNIVATKNNHIPFRSEFIINESNTSINIIDLSISNEELVFPGDSINIDFKIKNYGIDTINNFDVEIAIDDPSISLINNQIQLNDSILNGETSNTILFNGIISPNIFTREINGEILVTYNDYFWEFPFSFLVTGSEINIIDFYNDNGDNFLNPNNNFINLIFYNYGVINSDILEVNLYSNHNFLNLNETITIPEIAPNESYIIENYLNFQVSEESYSGFQIPVNISYMINGDIVSEKIFSFPIGEITSNDPSGPDQYGYYIYDSNDYGYTSKPDYYWIEIDPYFLGTGTILVDLNDNGENQDDITFINMPFDFKFYGQEYEQISISTNGWLKPGLTNQSSFRNWRIPGAGGPSPMIAAFWDDLETSSGRICVQYDSDNNWYIIEWSSVQNGFDGSNETFQVIIYDQNYYPTSSGDNIIKIQYKEFNNVNSGHYDTYNQWHGNYASIGIENEFSNIGIEYTWNNEYLSSASILDNESAILITTNPPIVESYLIGDINQDSQLNILDIINIINIIINNNVTNNHLFLADVNQDNQLNILDVIFIVNTIIET